MSTPVLPALVHTCEGSGKLIAAILDNLPPQKLAEMQKHLQDGGGHLGMKIDFTDTGIYALLFVEGPGFVEPVECYALPEGLLDKNPTAH